MKNLSRKKKVNYFSNILKIKNMMLNKKNNACKLQNLIKFYSHKLLISLLYFLFLILKKPFFIILLKTLLVTVLQIYSLAIYESVDYSSLGTNILMLADVTGDEGSGPEASDDASITDDGIDDFAEDQGENLNPTREQVKDSFIK